MLKNFVYLKLKYINELFQSSQNTGVVFLSHTLIPQMLSFDCVDSLHPSQHFFSHAGMSLPGLNQY